MEKCFMSSTELLPGTKKVGDGCSKERWSMEPREVPNKPLVTQTQIFFSEKAWCIKKPDISSENKEETKWKSRIIQALPNK